MKARKKEAGRRAGEAHRVNQTVNPPAVATLPVGWRWAALADLTEAKVDQSGPLGERFTYIDISSIDNAAKRIVEPRTLATTEAPSRARQRLRADDVVVSMTRPNLNAVAIVPAGFDGAIGTTGFHVLRHRDVDPRWLYYAVQWSEFVKAMCGLVQGALYPAVRPKDVKAFRIPVPPLAEQRRLVNAIEESLSVLESAVALMRRAKANALRFRNSVLSDAYARNWPRKTLGSVTACGPDNGIYLPKHKYGTGTPILRIDDFQDFWSRSMDELRLVAAEPSEVERYGLQVGDLVINRVNSPSHLGKCLVVEDRHVPAVFESNMMRMRLTPDVDPRFVAFFLRSPEGRAALTANAKWAVNQASINQKDVASTEVPVPSLDVQRTVVQDVEHRMMTTRRLLETMEVQLRRAVRLRQAIVDAALAGQLLPADTIEARVQHDAVRQPTVPGGAGGRASRRRAHVG